MEKLKSFNYIREKKIKYQSEKVNFIFTSQTLDSFIITFEHTELRITTEPS